MQYIGVGYIGGDGENEAEHAFLLHNYPGPIGEAELYAIKVALEKQVQLNAEVERLRQRKQYRPKESWVAKFPVTAAQ